MHPPESHTQRNLKFLTNSARLPLQLLTLVEASCLHVHCPHAVHHVGQRDRIAGSHQLQRIPIGSLSIAKSRRILVQDRQLPPCATTVFLGLLFVSSNLLEALVSLCTWSLRIARDYRSSEHCQSDQNSGISHRLASPHAIREYEEICQSRCRKVSNRTSSGRIVDIDGRFVVRHFCGYLQLIQAACYVL